MAWMLLCKGAAGVLADPFQFLIDTGAFIHSHVRIQFDLSTNFQTRNVQCYDFAIHLRPTVLKTEQMVRH